MDWQPISTAPKDGRNILACKPGQLEPWVVRWRDGKRKQGWETTYAFIMWVPVYWMPLPAPPQD